MCQISLKGDQHFELNVKGNTIDQNLWDIAKVVLRGKFLALNAYIREEEKYLHLSTHFKNLG